ncbi:hypothetical protein FXO37_05797 [Capsicum annuum]|nr:hypothetical protein FXO37_05797 [Capsicum annuum]
MSLETRKSSTSVIVIRAKGTILHFTIREFALVTGLNCAANKDEFVFDEECPNKIIDQYFDGESFVQKKGLFAIVSDKIWGNDNNEDALIVANLYFIHAFLPNDNNEDALIFADLYFIHAFLLSSVDTVVIPHLHFNLVESDRYSDYLWGSIAFEELARSLHSKLKPKGKFYMLLGMPLAIQIWLYECCSNVPRNVAFKVDSQIPRILNWKTNSPHPRYETLMGSMFDDTNDKLTTKKKFHGDSSASPAKKKLKPHPKGVDEQIAKRTPPPRSAKIPFARTPIHKPIQTKVTLHGNRKDINRPDIKKSISVQSPTPSSFSSEDEDGVVSKKVFDKFCEKVWQEFNDVCGLVSSRNSKEEHYLKGKTKIPVIKFEILSVEDKNWFYVMGTPSQTWSDEKFKYDPNISYKFSIVDCNFMNNVISVFDVYKLDDVILNAGGKKYHLNEYVSGFRMHAAVPWHTIDHMFILVHVKAKHHWVLAVISFNHRCIYVYDSLSAAGHNAAVLTEIEKLAKVISICLIECKFYENKGIDIDNHPNYKLNDKMNPFGVSIVENVPQQPSVPSVDFDLDLIHIRYASLLWDYGTTKAKAKAQSDDEAPMRPLRITELTEGTEVVDIRFVFYFVEVNNI